MPITILLTGAGAPGTRGTLYALRHNPEGRAVRVLGVDARPNAVGRHFIEGFWPVPLPDEASYGEALLALCTRHGVDLVIPQTTRESAVLAGMKARFAEAGVRIMVADPGPIATANHKGRMLALFDDLGLPYPAYRVAGSKVELCAAASSLGYPARPVAVKPPVSNGMRGFRILKDDAWNAHHFLTEKPSGLEISLDELTAVLSRGTAWPTLLVSEYLPGPEYSVDAFLGASGGIAVPRRRQAIVGGISAETVLEPRADLAEATLRAAGALGLRYAFGFQYKLDAEGTPKLLECNPRVQGTMVAGVFGGVNVIWLAVQEALGGSPKPPTEVGAASFQRFWGGIGGTEDGWHEI